MWINCVFLFWDGRRESRWHSGLWIPSLAEQLPETIYLKIELRRHAGNGQWLLESEMHDIGNIGAHFSDDEVEIA